MLLHYVIHPQGTALSTKKGKSRGGIELFAQFYRNVTPPVRMASSDNLYLCEMRDISVWRDMHPARLITPGL